MRKLEKSTSHTKTLGYLSDHGQVTLWKNYDIMAWECLIVILEQEPTGLGDSIQKGNFYQLQRGKDKKHEYLKKIIEVYLACVFLCNNTIM